MDSPEAGSAMLCPIRWPNLNRQTNAAANSDDPLPETCEDKFLSFTVWTRLRFQYGLCAVSKTSWAIIVIGIPTKLMMHCGKQTSLRTSRRMLIWYKRCARTDSPEQFREDRLLKIIFNLNTAFRVYGFCLEVLRLTVVLGSAIPHGKPRKRNRFLQSYSLGESRPVDNVEYMYCSHYQISFLNVLLFM